MSETIGPWKPRTRTVEIDGCLILIAPLTMKQAEDFKLGKQAENVDAAQMLKRNREIVAQGLSNANGHAWTEQEVYETLDSISFVAVYKGIIEMSGFEIKTGETPAAS